VACSIFLPSFAPCPCNIVRNCYHVPCHGGFLRLQSQSKMVLGRLHTLPFFQQFSQRLTLPLSDHKVLAPLESGKNWRPASTNCLCRTFMSRPLAQLGFYFLPSIYLFITAFPIVSCMRNHAMLQFGCQMQKESELRLALVLFKSPGTINWPHSAHRTTLPCFPRFCCQPPLVATRTTSRRRSPFSKPVTFPISLLMVDCG
jgi:hypothetical protein